MKDYELEEIENCIEGEPEIGTHNIYPGKGKTEAIIGMNSESVIPNEGRAAFDIRFHILTKGEERVKLIINVEAQNSYYVSYPHVFRGLFYCSRMISEQKNTEFAHDNYQDLKKVYSIWLYMDSPDYAAHTITAYTISQHNLYGEYEEKERYDLMSVIAVRLAVNKDKEGGNPLHNMLETLFSSRLSIQEKEKKLEQEFGMRMTEEVKKGASSMCNYSDWVEEQGKKSLLEEQIKKKLDKNMSVKEIAEALEQEEGTIEKIIKEMMVESV